MNMTRRKPACAGVLIAPLGALVWAVLGAAQAFPAQGAFTAAPPRIMIVAGPLEIHRTVAEQIAAELRRRPVTPELAHLPPPDHREELDALVRSIAQDPPAVILTVGDQATEWACVRVRGVPIVFTLVANALDESYVRVESRTEGVAAGGIAADLAPRTLLEEVRACLPSLRRAALLHSSSSLRTAESIREAGKALDIDVVLVPAEQKRFLDALTQLENTAPDAVLMIPDPQVYDGAAIRSLLTWGARRSTPIWGFSANVVKAGAYAGAFFDDRRIAAQTADLVLRMLDPNAGPLSPLDYAACVRRAVNLHTSGIVGKRVTDAFLSGDVLKYGDEP
ncbi:MAG: hypothetical protein KJ057_05075 [Phycisphaerae bacterium]|nr:MAG: hypothetical protein EDS66_10110 [Planctomycetota bacterium]KAB2945170.1 MAG: hypothetical protein F9K17_10410 [Phycisphaerae bacterium]MBE7456789.1 hypothetical protein [Planctomycetia bacterium]MCK6464238.1 hypothetical protein [Phycisphaerae bacterium]MCL4717829.1 hypothetical protein [Phycisphaerae bacterium]